MQRREFIVAAAATPIVGFPDFERVESDFSELPESDDPMVWFGLLSVAVEAPVDEEEALEAAEWCFKSQLVGLLLPIAVENFTS